MDIPLEIAFHNIKPAAEIEALVRKHISRLEKLYPHLIGCRVSIEMLHKQHRNGNMPAVHIAIRVPGREIAISREPHRTRQRRASPDVHGSLKDAFRAAEKRLKDFKDLQYGDVKTKEMPAQGLHRTSDVALQHPADEPRFHEDYSLLNRQLDEKPKARKQLSSKRKHLSPKNVKAVQLASPPAPSV